MPLFLHDLCKSIVWTTKRAPARVCDVIKCGSKPIAPYVVKNALTSCVNRPFVKFDTGMQRSRAWCGTPPILGVVNMVGTRNFTCYMGAL